MFFLHSIPMIISVFFLKFTFLCIALKFLSKFYVFLFIYSFVFFNPTFQMSLKFWVILYHNIGVYYHFNFLAWEGLSIVPRSQRGKKKHLLDYITFTLICYCLYFLCLNLTIVMFFFLICINRKTYKPHKVFLMVDLVVLFSLYVITK